MTGMHLGVVSRLKGAQIICPTGMNDIYIHKFIHTYMYTFILLNWV